MILKHADIDVDIMRCPEPQTLGLTFDDGPNCSHNAFYDYLLQNNQKATMFYVGSNVIHWPYQAQRGLTDNHHIAGHSYNHPYITTLNNNQVLAELYYTQKAMKIVMEITPYHWRPPHGDVDDRIRAIAQQMGLKIIMWGVDTGDYQLPLVPLSVVDQKYQKILGAASSYTNSGIIVLAHELSNMTMGEYMKFHTQIKNTYAHVMPVASCLNVTSPYHESSFTYPDFASYR